MKIKLLALFLCMFLGACATQSTNADSDYKPMRGQMGKDVMWLQTAQNLVNQMLAMAQIKSDDVVYDLGAGDGIIPITASKVYGVQSVGIEYHQKLADFAKKNAIQAGVGDKVNIIKGDIFVEDFSKATVVTMYLLPELNLQLRTTLLQMKPGTRVVSHEFDMGEWQHDQFYTDGKEKAFLWIVPANVKGVWHLKDSEAKLDARIQIDQQFQSIGGTITYAGQQKPLLGAQIKGAQIRFQFVASDDSLFTVQATLNQNTMSGELWAWGRALPFEIQRQP